MAIPKYDELYRDFLDALADGETHSLSEIRKRISEARNMSAEDLQQLLPSGSQTVFANRVNWAGIYLNKAGLIGRIARGKYTITPEGKKLRENPDIAINTNYLLCYPSFKTFLNGKTNVADEQSTPPPDKKQQQKRTKPPLHPKTPLFLPLSKSTLRWLTN